MGKRGVEGYSYLCDNCGAKEFVENDERPKMPWITVDLSKEKMEEDRPTKIQAEKWHLTFCCEGCMKKHIALM